MGLREEKKERQRCEILDAAIDLFRARGYDQTRVQDIIDRLRISEATFFNYFPSKDALLHEFVLRQIDRESDQLRKVLADGRETVRERIRKVAKRIACAWSTDRDFMAVAVARSNLFSATGQLKEKELRNYSLVARLFQEGQRRGEFRRNVAPAQLAEMFTAIYSFTAGNWLIGWWEGPQEALATRLMRAVDILLDGCAIPSEKRAASAITKRKSR